VFANTGSIIAFRFAWSPPPWSVWSTRRMCA
jgi:hypothetical protein